MYMYIVYVQIYDINVIMYIQLYIQADNYMYMYVSYTHTYIRKCNNFNYTVAAVTKCIYMYNKRKLLDKVMQ